MKGTIILLTILFAMCVSILFGCTEKEPQTAIKENADETTFYIRIHVSAEDPPNPGIMPFPGKVGLWHDTSPFSPPTVWDPDNELTWNTGDSFPTLSVPHQGGSGNWYIYYVAIQTTATYPPSPWEMRTRAYSDIAYDDDDYDGYCVFYKN